jgi:hypothetical protein
VKRSSAPLCFAIAISFCAGFLAHILYVRWKPVALETAESPVGVQSAGSADTGQPQSYRVSFVPLTASPSQDYAADLPVLASRDVEKIRGLAGQQARIRGRVFRVGHSAKSNTYFLSFGPSREALTAVIFASATELFDKNKLPPKKFENREVEISGSIKDHPQYGLEIVLEHPKQIKIMD